MSRGCLLKWLCWLEYCLVAGCVELRKDPGIDTFCRSRRCVSWRLLELAVASKGVGAVENTCIVVVIVA